MSVKDVEMKCNEINKLKVELGKLVEMKNYAGIIGVLNSLDDCIINVEILKSTKIGAIINRLKKQTLNKDIINKSKKLVIKWKNSINYKCKKKGIKKIETKWKTGNPIKDKFRKKFIEILKMSEDENYHENRIILTGIDIENELELLSDNIKKEKYRDLIFNMKKNSELRISVLNGSIKAKELILMSNDELANKKLKLIRKENIDKSINELICARNDGKTKNTNEYKCFKCNQRNCHYSQAQTRSADEPMTIFITCLSCGNKWKN